MGSSGVEAVDRKQKIRDRYKGWMLLNWKLSRQRRWRGLEKAPLFGVLRLMSVFPLTMMSRLLPMNFRKITIQSI